MNNNIYTKDIEFYACSVCGNLIIKLVDSGLNPQCCGRDMIKLEAGTVDASSEKHVPVWKMCGCKIIVTVGEEPHPMTKEHYIQWIIVKTNQGIHARKLTPEDTPEACFKLCKGEEVEAVYEYCNLHKLWKADAKEAKQDECNSCGM